MCVCLCVCVYLERGGYRGALNYGMVGGGGADVSALSPLSLHMIVATLQISHSNSGDVCCSCCNKLIFIHMHTKYSLLGIKLSIH